MLKRFNDILIVGLIAVLTSGMVFAAQSFTTLNAKAYHGKTNIKPLTAAIDANFAQVNTEAVTASASTNLTLTSAHYGQHVMLSSNAVIAVALPANGAAAGTVITVSIIGNDSCAPVISAATVDTLIGPNDVDLDSVTWATGHRINATAKFWSDGSFWHVQNLGGTTMTYTD